MEKQQTSIKVVCDFDGTICPEDVLHELIVRFGDPTGKSYLELEDAWSQKLYRRLMAGLSFSDKDLDNFLHNYQVDPYFAIFARHCREKNWPLYVLSDGLDLYIKPLLAKENLKIPVYCNRFLYTEDTPRVAFPYGNQQCGRCGNCKKNVLAFLKEQDKIIYVGDGHSDRCAAEDADLLFAIGHLQTICDKKNVSYVPVNSFKDVMAYLSKKSPEDLLLQNK